MGEAVISLFGHEAVLDDMADVVRWRSDGRAIAKLLNTLLPDPEDGPHAYDPYPLKTAAQDAVDVFGAEIISVSEPIPIREGLIY